MILNVEVKKSHRDRNIKTEWFGWSSLLPFLTCQHSNTKIQDAVTRQRNEKIIKSDELYKARMLEVVLCFLFLSLLYVFLFVCLFIVFHFNLFKTQSFLRLLVSALMFGPNCRLYTQPHTLSLLLSLVLETPPSGKSLPQHYPRLWGSIYRALLATLALTE